MDPQEYEQKFEELKAVGQHHASYPAQMENDDLAVLATLLVFMTTEMAMLMRINLEIWKLLKAREAGADDDLD